MVEEVCQTREGRQAPSHYKKKKGAPVLRVDDGDFFADCDSCAGDSESSSTDVSAGDVFDSFEALESAHLATSDLDSVPSDVDSFPSISLEAKESAGVSMATADVSVGTKTEWEQDFSVLELASDASDDSWTHFDDGTESYTLAEGFQTSSQLTWEELSEVSSVVSFNSKTGMSFLAAARAAPNQSSGDNNSWKEVSKASKPTSQLKTIAEHRKLTVCGNDSSYDDDGQRQGEMFDADFMFDGAKCGRGGKVKFMFNHQPRRKYHRFHQRQRSSVRMRQF